jgi:hypothetical protein
MRHGCTLLAALLLACGQPSASLTSLTNTTASGISTGASSSGSTAGSNSGAGTSTSGSSSGSSTSTGASTAGTTTGGASISCGPMGQWRGDVCATTDCSHTSDYTPCALSDGGSGSCLNGKCASVDYQDDPQNCGAIGVVCLSGRPCIQGVCGGYVYDCQSGSCPAHTLCGWNGGCVTTDCSTASPEAACAASTHYGVVQVGRCCDGACRLSDSSHCGGCSITCGSDATCVGDYCLAAVHCDSTTNGIYGCKMTNGNTGLCCSGTCTDPSSWCAAVAVCGPESDDTPCVSDAGTYTSCCGGSCVDPYSEPNCGGCGVTCKPGYACVGIEGICARVQDCADAGAGPCALSDGGIGTCCGRGACVDLTMDLQNCGYCNGSCALGATACVSSSCFDDGGNFVFCQSDQECPAGLSCTGLVCEPPSCDGGSVGCALGDSRGICCAGQCVLDSCTVQDCTSEVSGSWCMTQLPGGGTCCDGQCVQTWDDPNNCGACGAGCGDGGWCYLGNCSDFSRPCLQTCGQGTICADGQCVGSQCWSSSFSWWYVNLPYCLAANGAVGACCGDYACADFLTDPSHCGVCDIACPAGQTCQDGFCNGLTECGPGHAGVFCNLDAGLAFRCCPGLGCIDTSSDPQNCGRCGYACGAGQICNAGTCN